MNNSAEIITYIMDGLSKVYVEKEDAEFSEISEEDLSYVRNKALDLSIQRGIMEYDALALKDEINNRGDLNE